MGRINNTYRAFAALTGLLLVTACTVHKQEAPSLTGPSELGTAIVLTVSPDVVSQDGSSQSLVQITARDNNGQPLRNVSLRVEIRVGGAITDFGRLSAKNVVTDTSGRAAVTYTAPDSVGGVTTDVVVQIVVTPAESDYASATTRVVNIRVVPVGSVGPPASSLKPAFDVPSPTVGNTTTFSASVTDANGNDASAQVTSYSWDFGDGGAATGQNVTHTYNNVATVNASLTIVDTLGRTQRVTHAVSVGQGNIPTANIIISPTNPSIHQTVTFNGSGSTAEAGHRITDFSWSFGDGAFGSGAIATHSYDADGSYTVTLKVTDDAGRKSTLAQGSVSVGVGGPTASFTSSPSSPSTGQQVNFDASQSKATTGRTITSYAWIFDDGSTGSGVAPTHTYSAGGSYTVRLTVTDNQGATGVTTNTVSVSSSAPTANITFAPSSPTVGQSVTFSGAASTAPSGRTITGYAWNFGDGGTGVGVQPSHTYSVAGTYSVVLTVTDSLGQTAFTSTSVTVSAVAGPTATFTLSTSNPVVGQSVNFTSTSTPGGYPISTYLWSFGDGATSSANPATHAYSTTGSWQVTLTVTDNHGQSATSQSQTVTVANASVPTANIATPVPSPAVVGQTVTFNGQGSTAGTGRSIASYAWDFGDGTTGVGATPTHVYNTIGNFTITLTVADNGSPALSNSTTTSLSVSDGAAFIGAPGGTTGTAPGPVTVSFDATGSTAASGRTIVSYAWTFSNGGTATGVAPTHDFLAPLGNTSYSATLTITDNAGHTNTVTKTFTVTGT